MEHLSDIKFVLISLGVGFCIAFVLYTNGARVFLKWMEFVAILLSTVSLIPAIGATKNLFHEFRLRGSEALVVQNGQYIKSFMEMRESEFCSQDSHFHDEAQCRVIRNNKSTVLSSVDKKIGIPTERIQLEPPSNAATQLASVVQWYNNTVAMRGKDSQPPTQPSYESLYNNLSLLFAPVILAFTIGMKLGQTAFEIGEEKQKEKSGK